MNKKVLLSILGVLIAAGVSFYFLTTTTSDQKVYHVGVLSGVDIFASITDGFKAKMTELGYVEGKNIVYDVINANPDPVVTRQALQKFVDAQVDLIFAFPTEPSLEAKELTKSTGISVVFALGTVEDIDLVQSVREPGGNLTGVRYPSPELAVKRFEILHELMPKLKNLWLIYDKDYPATKSAIRALRPIAEAAHVTLVEDFITGPNDVAGVLAKRGKLSTIGVDAILIMPETNVQSPIGWPLVSAFAAEHKLPIAGSASFEADAGAVFTLIPDNVVMGKMAATLADKVFRGIVPGTIPVETPESRLRLNYKRATELGLTVGDGLLNQASDIIR